MSSKNKKRKSDAASSKPKTDAEADETFYDAITDFAFGNLPNGISIRCSPYTDLQPVDKAKLRDIRLTTAASQPDATKDAKEKTEAKPVFVVMWYCWNEHKNFRSVRMRCFATEELAEKFKASRPEVGEDDWHFQINRLVPSGDLMLRDGDDY